MATLQLANSAVWRANTGAWQVSQTGGVANGAVVYTMPSAHQCALVRMQMLAETGGTANCSIRSGNVVLNTVLSSNTISLQQGNTVVASNTVAIQRGAWLTFALRQTVGKMSVALDGTNVLGPVQVAPAGANAVYQFGATGNCNVFVRNVAIEPVAYFDCNVVAAKGIKADSFFGNVGWSVVTDVPQANATTAGVVKLVDSVQSTATDQAATANACRAAFVSSNNRLLRAGDTMTGQLNVATSVGIMAANTGGTDARLYVQAASGGDAYASFQAYGNAKAWSMGMGNSSASTFRILPSNTFANGASAGLGIDATGNVTITGQLTSLGSLSDACLKHEVVPMDGSLSLVKLASLNPVHFRWRDDIPFPSKRGQDDEGLIAQEVAQVYPLATDRAALMIGDQTHHIVRYEKLVPLLISGMQHLAACVAALEERLFGAATLGGTQQ
jgi:hypothetical protein